jgi:hypothetical protein
VKAKSKLLAFVVIKYLYEVSLGGEDELSRVVQGNINGVVKYFKDSLSVLM